MSRYLGRSTRCVRCRFPVHLCLCPYVVTVPTETRVVVLLDARENTKPTNTGHLARLMLPEAEVRVAAPTGAVEAPIEPRRDRRVLLLFPREDARELSLATRFEDPRPLTLVVPDAAWRQSRRMVRRWPVFQGLPAVRLPEVTPPSQVLRKMRRPSSSVGTLDAIARALGLLESQYVEDRIRAVLERAVRRGLYARGRARPDDEIRAQLAAARAAGLEVP